MHQRGMSNTSCDLCLFPSSSTIRHCNVNSATYQVFGS